MKVKFRKVTIDRWSFPIPFVPFEEFELDCKGNGTENDPIIIDSSIILPWSVEIMESSNYIVFQNQKLGALYLYYCKNIKIDNSEIGKIFLLNCSEISIKNIKLNLMILLKCNKCSIISCVILEFMMYNSHYNILKDTMFRYKFYDYLKLSRGNVCENNDVYDLSKHIHIPLYTEIQKPILENKETFTLYNRIGLSINILELENLGTGTKENPIIIDSNKIDYNIIDNKAFKSLNLSYYHPYIIFRNFTFKKLKLGDCQHITFEKCNILKLCNLSYCSKILMNFCEIKTLSFDMCQDTIFVNSNIKRIKAIIGNKGNISLKSSTVRKIEKNAPEVKYF